MILILPSIIYSCWVISPINVSCNIAQGGLVYRIKQSFVSHASNECYKILWTFPERHQCRKRLQDLIKFVNKLRVIVIYNPWSHAPKADGTIHLVHLNDVLLLERMRHLFYFVCMCEGTTAPQHRSGKFPYYYVSWNITPQHGAAFIYRVIEFLSTADKYGLPTFITCNINFCQVTCHAYLTIVQSFCAGQSHLTDQWRK